MKEICYYLSPDRIEAPEGRKHRASSQCSRRIYPVGDAAWRRDDGVAVGLQLARIRLHIENVTSPGTANLTAY